MEDLPKEILIQVSLPEYKMGSMVRVDGLDKYINSGYSIKEFVISPTWASGACGGSYSNGHTVLVKLTKI